MMWWDWFGGGAAMGLIMSLFSLLVLAAVVVGLVVLVRALSAGTSRPQRSRALEVLEERFARGEIDLDEFEQRRRALTSG